MAGEVAFNGDDEVKFNQFGQVVLCKEDCCDACRAWQRCLDRSYFVIRCDGIDAEELLRRNTAGGHLPIGGKGYYYGGSDSGCSAIDGWCGYKYSPAPAGGLAFSGSYVALPGSAGNHPVDGSQLMKFDPFDANPGHESEVGSGDYVDDGDGFAEPDLENPYRDLKLTLRAVCEEGAIKFQLGLAFDRHIWCALLACNAAACHPPCDDPGGGGGTYTGQCWGYCGVGIENCEALPDAVLADGGTDVAEIATFGGNQPCAFTPIFESDPIPLPVVPDDLRDVALHRITGSDCWNAVAPLGTTARVSLIGSCLFIQNCQICEPDDDVRTPNTPATLSIGVSGSGCSKTLTAVIPGCIDYDEDNVVWSTGQTGTTISHVITRPKEGSATDREEKISVTVFDNRGCRYRASLVVGCGCGCATSGSPVVVDVTYSGDDDEIETYHIAGSCSGDPECIDGSSILIQWDGSGGWRCLDGSSPDACGDCDGPTTGQGGVSCSGIDQMAVSVAPGERKCGRWAFASSACCVGEWHYFAIEHGVGMTSWDGGPCCDCEPEGMASFAQVQESLTFSGSNPQIYHWCGHFVIYLGTLSPGRCNGVTNFLNGKITWPDGEEEFVLDEDNPTYVSATHCYDGTVGDLTHDQTPLPCVTIEVEDQFGCRGHIETPPGGHNDDCEGPDPGSDPVWEWEDAA